MAVRIATDRTATGGTGAGSAGSFVSARPQARPLDPLTAKELKAVFRIVQASPRFPKGAFFPTIRLQEPPKATVLAWSPGKPFGGRALAEVYDRPGNRLYRVVVDLRRPRVASWTLQRGVQPAVSETEFEDADTLMRADPRWQRAMRRRGLDPKDVYLDVWAPGDVDLKGAAPGVRYLRAFLLPARHRAEREGGEGPAEPVRPSDRGRRRHRRHDAHEGDRRDRHRHPPRCQERVRERRGPPAAASSAEGRPAAGA